jgi:hypothetical protein
LLKLKAAMPKKYPLPLAGEGNLEQIVRLVESGKLEAGL